MPDSLSGWLPWILFLFAVAVIAVLLVRYNRSRQGKRGGSVSPVGPGERERYGLLESLIDYMPDYIYAKDRESRFVIANKHVASSHGISDPAEMTGTTDFDYYPEEVAGSFYRDEQSIMESGEPIVNKEETFFDRNSREIVLSTTKIPISDEQGRVSGIVGIGRDITRQKHAEKRLKELSTVASGTENVVVIMDRDGNFEWVNRGFEKRYGGTLEDFIKHRGRNLRDNSFNENISRILETVRDTGKPQTYTSRTRDSQGRDIWYQTNIAPILDEKGNVSGLFLIDSDISALKKADLQIKQQKYELESQRDELRRLNASKDRLFSTIAHDLKNPFQSIIGFSELLIKEKDELSRQQQKEYLEYIYESSSSAYNLLQNLLEWARTQTGSINTNPVAVPLRDLVDEAIALHAAEAGKKKIRLDNRVEATVKAISDQKMLQAVLRNLTSNAIKFTETGGSITYVSETEKERALLKVCDTGVGIPDHKIKTLFSLEKSRSTAGTDGETGSGFGLLLCREFLELNKGRIDVTSRPGQGSTFTLSLPLKTG